MKPQLIILFFTQPIVLCAQGPVFDWSRQIAGERDAQSYSIEVDVDGNVITMGYFIGSFDFDPGPSSFILEADNPSFQFYPDIFVQKLDSAGNFLWAVRFGGPMPDGAPFAPAPPGGVGGISTEGGVRTDQEGNVYVVGRFMSDSVDADPGPATSYIYRTPSIYWAHDYMVVKLDPQGNYLWGHAFGGKQNEAFGDLEVDAEGNIYIVGSFEDSLDLNPSPTAQEWLVPDGTSSSFLQKLDANGNLLWAKKLGGVNGLASASDLHIGPDGLLYVVGSFSGTFDFDLGQGVYELTDTVNTVLLGAFVLKLDQDGEFQWAGQFPGYAQSLCVSPNGEMNLLASLSTQDLVVDINPSPDEEFLVYNSSSYNNYILKLNSQGAFLNGGYTALLLSRSTLMLDSGGGLLFAGEITDTIDMDPGPQEEIFNPPPYGHCVIRLGHDLSLDWFRPLGGLLSLFGHRIGLETDASGNIYITSGFGPSLYMDLDPSPTETYSPPFTGWFYGAYDVFVLKWSQPELITSSVADSNPLAASIYPNPSEGRFRIDLGRVTNGFNYQVMDATGRVIQKGQQSQVQYLELHLDVPSGMYLTLITSDSGSVNVPLIVNKP